MTERTRIVESWYEKVSSSPKRVVLADSGDQRAAEARTLLIDHGLAEPVLVGTDIGTLAELDDPSVDEATEAALAQAAQTGRDIDIDDPLIIGAVLVKAGFASACVAGASRSTADVLRAGLRVLGLAQDASLLSSSFFMVLGDGAAISYGDCAVVPDPNAEQLAQIAVATAKTHRNLTDRQPRVAMLSYSTAGSATHPRIEKVRTATRIASEMQADLIIDGELQFDAAWLPEVAAVKAPASPVAGQANVFIFPDLDSGNIAYKITQRLAGASAFGPLLQGIGGIVHDLSRGCDAQDIVNVAVIASLQAQAGISVSEPDRPEPNA